MKTFYHGFALLRALLLFLLALTPALRMAGADPDIAPLRVKAEKGNSVAQYYLGLVYAEGRAVPKDPVEAYIWLSLAAENGATGKALGILVTEMSPDQLAAARFRLNERRRTTPGVISVPRSGASATPAEDHSDMLEQEAAIFRIDKAKLSDELAAAWKEADSAKAAAAAAEQRARQAEAGLSQRAKDLIALQTEREQLHQQLAAAPAASAVDALRQNRDKVASRLATANTDMQSLRERMAQIEAENDRLQQAAARAEQATPNLAALQQDRDKLAGRLATANADMQSLRERMAGMEAENDRLQLAATGTAHTAASLAALQRERDEQARSLAAVQASATELTAQVKKLGDEKAALTQANGRLEEHARTSARQAGDEAFARAEQARRALEATVAAETQKVAALTAELADTRKNLSVTEAGQAQAAAAAGKLEAARKELLSAQNANMELTAQVKKLTEDRESFGRQLAANGDATRDLTALRAKLESGGSDLDKLRSRNAELAAANQKLEEQARSAAQQAADRAAVAVAKAEEQRQALGVKVAERDGQLAAAQADQAQAAKLAAAFSVARKELAAAQSTNADLTVQLKILTEAKALLIQQAGRSSEASQEVASLKTKLGKAEADLSAIPTRNAELVAANQKLDERIHSATLQSDETARAKAALATAEQRARQAEATLGQRDKDLAVLQTDLQNSRRALKDFDAAQTAVAQAAATFEKNRQERDDLRQQLEAARKESAATRTSGAELGAQTRKLTEENAALKGQLADRGDAAQRLAAVTGQFDDTRKELLALKNHQAELNDSIRRLTEERGRLQTQAAAADTAKAEAARLQDQIATLTRQGDVARKDLAAAQTAAARENIRQLADLNLQLQQARQELGELHTQNQSLNEASQRLERQGKGTADAARQLAEAQTALEHLKLENAGLQSERTSLTARLAQAATVAAASTAVNVASNGAGSGEEVARLKEELARAESKVEMTVRSFALTQQENERLKAQIEPAGTSATQAHDAETALAGAQQELAAVRADASKTAAESASLRDFLRQMQNANASLATENSRLKTAVALAGGRLPAGSGAQPGRPAMVATSAFTPPATPAAPAPRTHRVVSGDTLTRISSRYYGTSSHWQDIYDANRDKLRSPDALPLDVELKIP
jgi:chromosome segregation ATPase